MRLRPKSWLHRPPVALCMCCLLASGCEQRAAEPEPRPRVTAPPQPTGEKPPEPARARTWSFDDVAVNQPPPGFRVAETGSAGTPATWQVVAEPTAPSVGQVVAITETKNVGQTYNLLIAEAPKLGDAEIHVMLRAVSGTQDRGGGVAFRVRDPDNYYVARWNPLENNFRFYIVQGGHRTPLAKADTTLEADAWHDLRVIVRGPKMQAYLDDELVLQVEDSTLQEKGFVALWTKADAATAFDDLSVTAL